MPLRLGVRVTLAGADADLAAVEYLRSRTTNGGGAFDLKPLWSANASRLADAAAGGARRGLELYRLRPGAACRLNVVAAAAAGLAERSRRACAGCRASTSARSRRWRRCARAARRPAGGALDGASRRQGRGRRPGGGQSGAVVRRAHRDRPGGWVVWLYNVPSPMTGTSCRRARRAASTTARSSCSAWRGGVWTTTTARAWGPGRCARRWVANSCHAARADGACRLRARVQGALNYNQLTHELRVDHTARTCASSRRHTRCSAASRPRCASTTTCTSASGTRRHLPRAGGDRVAPATNASGRSSTCGTTRTSPTRRGRRSRTRSRRRPSRARAARA